MSDPKKDVSASKDAPLAPSIKEAKAKKEEAKRRTSVVKRIEEAVKNVAEEERLAIVKPGEAHPLAALTRPIPTRVKGLAAYIRAEFSDLPLIAGQIGRGERKATREQVVMLKDMIDRGWGKAPDTMLVGAMSEEQRDEVAQLTSAQLLGLLDTTLDTSAAQSATVEGEVTEILTDTK